MKTNQPEILTTTVGSYSPIDRLDALPSAQAVLDATSVVINTQRNADILVPNSRESNQRSGPQTLGTPRPTHSAIGTRDEYLQAGPQVLFLGMREYLGCVFPPDLRAEVSGIATILGETSSDELAQFARLDRTEIIFSTWGMPTLDAELLNRLPSLRAVFYAAGSVKGFATPEAFQRGIVFSSAASANAIPVAEFSAATILLALKRVFPHMRAARDHRTFCRMPVPGSYKTRVGLVSLGVIAQLTARKLRSLEVEVLAYDPFATSETAADLGVRLVDLTELFAECEVVSIHTPHLPETEGMIGADLISSMKEGATLLNTSRGVVIDEPALCRILKSRPDLTAILDVTHPEPPLPDSPLFRLPNVFLTPHIAGSIDGEVERMGRWMVDEFARYLEGSPLQHRVTQEMLGTMA